MGEPPFYSERWLMAARVIDGKATAQQLRASIAQQVRSLSNPPGLATVLVGDDPASHTYVRSKHKACEAAGMRSFDHKLDARASQAQVEELVGALGEDPRVHGILVQLPLPDHLDEEAVLNRVPLHKDVDGFHPVNIGRLAQKGRHPLFVPCTPAGCLHLLNEAGVGLKGAHAVVVGRSNIVGMPMSLLLLRQDATVTIVHSRTRNLAEITREADVLVVAIGKAEFLRGSMIKPGCAILDVGINRTESGLVGDVAYEECAQTAGWITPVPGGVGPMTIAMLLQNTLRAATQELSRQATGSKT